MEEIQIMSDTPWEHFSRAELRCRCGCPWSEDQMNDIFMQEMERIRIKLGSRVIRGKKGSKDEGKQIGHKIMAKTVKNKVSAPFRETNWNFMYRPDGSGEFDVAR